MDCTRCAEAPADSDCQGLCTSCYIELDLMCDWTAIRKFTDGWWFRDSQDAGRAYGPYNTKAEAAADAAGLKRFHKGAIT